MDLLIHCRVWRDAMDLLLEYGKIPWTSRVRIDTMDLIKSMEIYYRPTTSAQKVTMGLLLEYEKMAWTYF